MPHLLAAIFALLLASCATAPPPRARAAAHPPSQAAYPPHRYITGIGQGATAELARQRAMTAIAGQIQGRLWAEETVSAEEVRGSSGSQRHDRERESVREEIHVEVRLPRTEWVQVVSHTSSEGQHEVLAVLDREDASRILREEIDRATSSLASALDAAMAAPGLLARSRAVEALQGKRDELLASLALLAGISRHRVPDPPALLAFESFRASLSASWAAVRWEVCLGGEQASQREGALAARLAGAGLDALPCGAPGAGAAESRPWRLVGRLDVNTQTLRQPGAYPVFCSTHLEFRVVDEAQGVQGGGSATGLRAGGMGPGAACASSLGSLVDELLSTLGHPAGGKGARRRPGD